VREVFTPEGCEECGCSSDPKEDTHEFIIAEDELEEGEEIPEEDIYCSSCGVLLDRVLLDANDVPFGLYRRRFS
jgi:hypothetical protein